MRKAAISQQRALGCRNGMPADIGRWTSNSYIRSIPDFPKPGILFYDISTLLAHPHAWRTTVERLAGSLQHSSARSAGAGIRIARVF